MSARPQPSPPVSASKSVQCDDGTGGNSRPVVLTAANFGYGFDRCHVSDVRPRLLATIYGACRYTQSSAIPPSASHYRERMTLGSTEHQGFSHMRAHDWPDNVGRSSLNCRRVLGFGRRTIDIRHESQLSTLRHGF